MRRTRGEADIAGRDSPCRSRIWSRLRCHVATAFLVFVASAGSSNISFADEGGVSFWVPGLFGSLAAAPQVPGWQFAAINYYTNVNASGTVAAAREITI